MGAGDRFESYLEHLAQGLGHADRHGGLKGYCTGLMLPLARKSIEPLAAGVDPLHVSARHQSLHHFVAKADWSDEEMLRRVGEWVMPRMGLENGRYWIIDDTGFPKKGHHSVGVARQYCGVLGKQDNCQVAVSVSLASDTASLPVTWQLYLPQAWADDPERRRKAGVPDSIVFATKTQIALQHLQRLLSQAVAPDCVLADAGYGVDTAFRQQLSDMGLTYTVGITSAISVWPPDVEPLPPLAYSGRGRVPVQPRRTPQRQPLTVKALAQALPARSFRTVRWREGSNQTLSSRFAAVRVRHGGGNVGRARLWPPQWLLIEWPKGQAEPEKYYLSTLPERATLTELVQMAHRRWRIERDYQELKQEFGLDHYEGRGWRGFHHHASLSVAAYGFLVAERLAGSKKNTARRQASAVPDDYIPRGRPQGAAPRAGLNPNPAPSTQRAPHRSDAKMPLLRKT
ncbi:MAG: IS701 family transposase [Panacagrimonas sp.]